MDESTGTTGLTDEAIRAELQAAWIRRPPNGPTPEQAWQDGWASVRLMADDPYNLDDMRESELDELDRLAEAAIAPIQADATARAIEALAGAMREYANRHPDTPRRVEAGPVEPSNVIDIFDGARRVARRDLDGAS